MTLKAAFIFLSPDADSKKDRNIVSTKEVELTVVATRNYDDAIAVAHELTKSGVESIELCGGFGHSGAALIAQAVSNEASVGAVRFDIHPGLGGVSGDTIFT